tara:strand:+ start:2203 stop:2637 length:435 start_codon:yes stop_codon:yes gene_type:complete
MTFYNEIYDIWIKEKDNVKLINLNRIDFFEQANLYLNHLDQQRKDEKDEILKEVFQKRYERSEYLVNDLINLRIEKFIRGILLNEGVNMENLGFDEEDLYGVLSTHLNNFKMNILQSAEEKEVKSKTKPKGKSKAKPKKKSDSK